MILADPGLIAEGFPPVAVVHEETAIAQAGQKRRESPDADGLRRGPGLSSVIGFALESFA